MERPHDGSHQIDDNEGGQIRNEHVADLVHKSRAVYIGGLILFLRNVLQRSQVDQTPRPRARPDSREDDTDHGQARGFEELLRSYAE